MHVKYSEIIWDPKLHLYQKEINWNFVGLGVRVSLLQILLYTRFIKIDFGPDSAPIPVNQYFHL